MFYLAISLDIVLTTNEVPQEIAPIHEVYLIGQEETQILGHCGYAILFLDSSHPVFIGLGMTCRMHTREIHVVLIHIVDVVAHDFVSLLCRVGHGAIDGFAFFLYRH